MRNHITAVHEKARDFICGTCGKTFSRKDKLKEHISSIHEGIKPAWEKSRQKSKNLSESSDQIRSDVIGLKYII